MLAAQDINDLCNNLMQKRDIEHIIVPKKNINYCSIQLLCTLSPKVSRITRSFLLLHTVESPKESLLVCKISIIPFLLYLIIQQSLPQIFVFILEVVMPLANR